MPGSDYIPSGDAQFNTWAEEFVTYAAAHQVELGLTVDEVADLTAAHGNWGTAWAALDTARNAAKGATQNKDETRDALESIVRTLAQKIQKRAETTDEQRTGLGLTIPDTTPTPLSPDIVLLTTPPVLELVCSAPKTVTVNWHPTEVGTDSTALPQGIDGISIWIAEKATDGTIGNWQWIALDTNPPYVHNAGNAATVTYVYRGQWFDRLKRMGPFGDMVEVAVTA